MVLLGAFVPLIGLLVPVLGLIVAIGCALLGEARAGLRTLGVALGGFLVGFVLLLPWSVTFVQRGVSWSVLSGAATDPLRAPQLGALLRLDLGPLGGGILGLAFFVAGLFALVAVDAARFGWATRLWCVLLGSLALAWAASEGWIGSGGGDLQVLVAPLAVLHRGARRPRRPVRSRRDPPCSCRLAPHRRHRLRAAPRRGAHPGPRRQRERSLGTAG